MKIWNLSWIVAVAIFAVANVSYGQAAEEAIPADAADAATEPAAESPDYDELVKQLDSSKFSDRQQAMRALQVAGPSAFEALERAAQGDSREAILRSVEILKGQYENGTDEAKAAAKSSLEKIASTGKPAAANRAKEVLEPPAPQQPVLPGFGGFQIAPGNIQVQIQGQAQAFGGKRVTMKNVNGELETEIVEGDRTVKINEAKSGEIKLEVTEKNKDGKAETKKYEAKNEEELKKNHPEAYKIYKEDNPAGKNGIQIRAFQMQPGIQGLPIPLQGRIQPFRAGGRAQQLPALELQKRQLERLQEQLKKAAEDTGNDGLKQVVEQLEEAKKQLEKSQAEIEAAEEKAEDADTESDPTEAAADAAADTQ